MLRDIELKRLQLIPYFSTNIYRWIKKLKENSHIIFKATARRLKIKLKHIKPHTPMHNGKNREITP